MIMEMLFTLLAFCEGIKWSLVDSAHKGPVMQSFDVFFIVSLNKLLNKQSSCGHMRPYDTHVISL